MTACFTFTYTISLCAIYHKTSPVFTLLFIYFCYYFILVVVLFYFSSLACFAVHPNQTVCCKDYRLKKYGNK